MARGLDPVERADAPEIDERGDENTGKHRGFHECRPAEREGRDGPGEEEYGFDIEDDEEDGHEVKLGGQPYVRGAFGDDAGFVRLAGGGLRMALAQKVREGEHSGDERQHKAEVESQSPHRRFGRPRPPQGPISISAHSRRGTPGDFARSGDHGNGPRKNAHGSRFGSGSDCRRATNNGRVGLRMTEAEKLADFAVRIRSSDLGDDVRLQLKIRVLDALGCAIGALGSPLAAPLREHMKEFGADGACMLIGGGRSAPDRAAFFNSALVRYLDFSDSYLAKGETCHPSDNLGAVLAACEYAGRSGADFLTALAVAYQVQCRLSDVAPVRAKGFDHTVQGSYALAAGVAKALGLDAQRTAHALAICGTAFNALRVTRTGALSNWKGLAYANTAFGCTHAALLAMHGITGPLEVFEGDRGFMQSIAGPFELDWSREGLDRIGQTILKRYNAEIHSQSAIDAVLELRRQMKLTGREVERVDVEIFDVAFRIIGGGGIQRAFSAGSAVPGELAIERWPGGFARSAGLRGVHDAAGDVGIGAGEIPRARRAVHCRITGGPGGRRGCGNREDGRSGSCGATGPGDSGAYREGRRSVAVWPLSSGRFRSCARITGRPSRAAPG